MWRRRKARWGGGATSNGSETWNTIPELGVSDMPPL